MANAYNFDPKTGEYTGKSPITPDPLTGELIPPAHATTNAPPKVGDDQVAVWDADAWTVQDDHRGVKYWDADGSAHLISQIGIAPPEGALFEAPPLPVHATAEVAIAAAYAWIEQLVHTQIDEGKPLSEVMTYQTRAAAARAVVAGRAVDEDHRVLAKLLVADGLDDAAALLGIPALAVAIKANADARDTALAETTGMRRRVEAQIQAADPVADPFAFDKILAQAAVDATAKWAELKTQTTTTTGGQNNA